MTDRRLARSTCLRWWVPSRLVALLATLLVAGFASWAHAADTDWKKGFTTQFVKDLKITSR